MENEKSSGKLDKLEKLASPLVKFLEENHNPYSFIMIDSESVRIVHSVEGIPVSFIKKRTNY